MIKLVASDLDGTIIDKTGLIYENNFKAINDLNKKNIDFVICTGKTYPIIKGMCSKFNANYGIFGNGNEIINLKTGEEIYKKLLTNQNKVLKYPYKVNYTNFTLVIYEKRKFSWNRRT